MPPVEKHVELCMKRTGKSFREVHEWMDSKEIGMEEIVARHDIANILRFLPIIKKQFGEEGIKAYLQHIKDDYENNMMQRILRRIKRIIGRD